MLKAMSRITTREDLENTSLIEGASEQPDATSVTRAVTLARCLRCGNEWLPRVPDPVACPRCKSRLWNVPRAQQLPGKPAPTRKGKPRGKPLQPGFDERRLPDRNTKPPGDETP